eukprot:3124005-Amphidinium_carterae.1
MATEVHKGLKAEMPIAGQVNQTTGDHCSAPSMFLRVSGNGTNAKARSELYVVLFVVSLVLSWGVVVAANVAHTAICGVFGRWYFDKHLGMTKAAVVMASIK